MRRINPFILSSVSLAALIATPAFAQDTPQDTAPAEALTSEQEAESGQDAQTDTNAAPPAADEGPAITVTGSRIRRPNLESPLPVTSIGGQEFFETGNTSVGDTLAELPAIRSTFTQANSTRFLGTAGLNLLDLRGLGTVRTLVLVNGRRHVGGDVLSSGVSVDVNTIPADLIDRVDVVTGGNSAVYGSDAIAGVVNFVLKQDYDGIMLRGQGGISKYGDAGSYFIAALAGQNFAGGRGNVAVNLEYARRDNAWGDERDWLHGALLQVDSDTEASGGDGTPDWQYFPGPVLSGSYSNNGIIRFNNGTCGASPNTGTNYFCSYRFQGNGDLVPVTGERVGVGPQPSYLGGNGYDFSDGHQVQVAPQLDRYSANLVGHFEISQAFVPFVEAKFSRTDSFGTGSSGPAFLNGTTYVDPFQFFGTRNRERLYVDNPFLTDQARGVICGTILPSCTANSSVAVREVMTGLGSRVEEARRDTYRIVGGIRGDIGGPWNYEISYNYGRLNEKTKVLGNLNLQRFLLANDVVADPTTGDPVCASQIDPDRAFGYWPWVYAVYYGIEYPYKLQDPNAAERLAADVAACTPINIAGGNFTDAQRAYLTQDTISKGRAEQTDFTAFISGDTSQWFELPGGPVGIVLGVEYRTDNAYYKQDPLIEQGYTFYNAIREFDHPKSKVKEAFGEIRLPILRDRPFFNELEVAGAARVSDYNLGNTGTVWAYNGNVMWSPVQGLRLRGNYARAVRAPNQVELFTALGQNFTPGNWTDPCSVESIGAAANRAANCLAAGVPAGTSITPLYGGSIGFLSGGNEALEAEKSDSITIGGVLTPTFLPGFSFSADYYDINVKNVITAPTAQQVFNACYDLPSLDNPYCALFTRAGAEGNSIGIPYGIENNSLKLTPLNYANLRARGLDFEVAYRRQLGGLGRIDTRFTYTHVLKLEQFIDPTDPDYGDRLLSEIGNPKDAFNWNTNLQSGRFNFGYQMRFIGKMTVAPTYEAQNSYQGRDPEDPDYSAREWYPTRFYHDVRLGVDVGPKYNFYVGVDNLTNEKPPYGASGIGQGTAIYDAIGRFFYAGVKANF